MTRVDRDDRFARRDPAGDAGEPARIAEGLDVQQDHRGSRVLLPPLEQFVGGHVHGVTHRHEAGEAEPQPSGEVEHREPQWSGLAGHRHPAGRRQGGREGRCQPRRGCRVDHAHAVGAHQPHAGGAGETGQLPLGGASFDAGLPEARGDDDHRLDADLGTLAHDIGDGLGPYGHQRQVRRFGQVPDARVRPHAGDPLGPRVDREHTAAEAAPQQVGHDLVPDRQGVPVGADHCDRARFEQGLERAPYGRVLAAFGPGHGLGLRVDGDLEVDDLAGRTGLDPVAGGEEHVDHPRVVGQDVGLQHPDAPRACGGGDVLQEQPAEPLALVVVPDGERDLGVLRFLRVADVAHQAGDLVTGQGDQRQLVEVVHVGAAPDDVVAGADHRPEGAVGQGGPGQGADERDQTVGVLGPDGADEGRPPGPDESGPFQVLGIRGIRGRRGIRRRRGRRKIRGVRRSGHR